MGLSLVVLAAGMGSRYGGLKQLDAFGPNGETIIDYSIHDAILAGFDKIVFIVREFFLDEFKTVFNKKFADRIELEFVTQELSKIPEEFNLNPERKKPWGTAHAVMMAHRIVNEPFGVINGDDYYGRESFFTLARYLQMNNEENEYALISYYLKNTLSDHGPVNRGVCKKDTEGNLTEIIECTHIERDEDEIIKFPIGKGHRVLSSDTIVSMNMFGFYPSYFDYFRDHFSTFLKEKGEELKSEFYIPDLLDILIKNKDIQVKILESDGKWFGVTYKEDKPFVMEKINALLANGYYPSRLW